MSTTVNVDKYLETLADECDSTPERVARAYTAIERIRLEFGIDAYLPAMLLNRARTIFTTAYETLAVTLSSNGQVIFLVNPNFACDLLADDTTPNESVQFQDLKFVVLHECGHTYFAHLRRSHVSTMAAEGFINYFVQKWMKRTGMAATDNWMPSTIRRDENGVALLDPKGVALRDKSGVDPRDLFAKYRKDLTEQGLTPVGSVDDLFETDEIAHNELARMSKPAQPQRGRGPCERVAGGSGANGESESGADDHMDTLDPTALGDVIGEIIRDGVRKVLAAGERINGTAAQRAKEDLLAMQAASDPDGASQLWGDLGMGLIRGKKTETRSTSFWDQFLTTQLATLLNEGEELVWDRTRPWDVFLSWVGEEEKFRILIAVDTSGSMHTKVLDRVAELVGSSPRFEATWVAFDGRLWPFTPGEEMSGGGGTTFEHIFAYAADELPQATEWGLERFDTPPDVTIVATDGYASHIAPADPSKVIWLITPDGDMWPAEHSPAMTAIQVDELNV